MKILFFTFALLSTVSANASDQALIAFERLDFELAASVSIAEKADSIVAYFDTLSRLGDAPASTGDCVKGIFGKKGTSFCFPQVQARSGTGGID